MTNPSPVPAASPNRTTLVDEVVCPNCWTRFLPSQVLYVATHPDLDGDFRLGPGHRQRFRPTRFHPEGGAIDACGTTCHELACPRCHLEVPRMLLECPAIFVSTFGAPSGGKSYFLAAMCHRLRHVLPREFAVNFSDADPAANAALHASEDALFGNVSGAWSSLPKTDVSGDRYRIVDFGGTPVRYPRSFFFQVGPAGAHRLAARPGEVTRVVCLYDNAGESFEPGRDVPGNPVTQHLARSGCLIFVFDPLQDAGFRKVLRAEAAADGGAFVSRQDVLLAEVARRIRSYHDLPATARHDRPLVVVVGKFDAWQRIVSTRQLPNPWTHRSAEGPATFRTDLILKVSAATRALLLQHAPTIVTTAESFVDPSLITYMPVSSTGTSPVLGPDGKFGFPGGSLEPVWPEVPFIHALSRSVGSIVATE
jgi:hypothetical protein